MPHILLAMGKVWGFSPVDVPNAARPSSHGASPEPIQWGANILLSLIPLLHGPFLLLRQRHGDVAPEIRLAT